MVLFVSQISKLADFKKLTRRPLTKVADPDPDRCEFHYVEIGSELVFS